jgi:hypothetical protein
LLLLEAGVFVLRALRVGARKHSGDKPTRNPDRRTRRRLARHGTGTHLSDRVEACAKLEPIVTSAAPSLPSISCLRCWRHLALGQSRPLWSCVRSSAAKPHLPTRSAQRCAKLAWRIQIYPIRRCSSGSTHIIRVRTNPSCAFGGKDCRRTALITPPSPARERGKG